MLLKFVFRVVRNPRRDQTVFNRGRPRLIRQEFLEKKPQVRLLDQGKSSSGSVDIRIGIRVVKGKPRNFRLNNVSGYC
jgi:hypothetical protein